jgi:hypothetical protein
LEKQVGFPLNTGRWLDIEVEGLLPRLGNAPCLFAVIQVCGANLGKVAVAVIDLGLMYFCTQSDLVT